MSLLLFLFAVFFVLHKISQGICAVGRAAGNGAKAIGNGAKTAFEDDDFRDGFIEGIFRSLF